MKALINKQYQLERFHGKGGWTYIRIFAADFSKAGQPARIKVKGSIDNYAIEKFGLMPLGEGAFMLPLKAEIRKAIRKKEGDRVHVVLYTDTDPLKVPEELLLCLQDEPEASAFFNSLSESERKYYIQWIYSAKRAETKMDRLTRSILKLSRREKFYAGNTKPL